jgi:small subunit ribosomal protein S21
LIVILTTTKIKEVINLSIVVEVRKGNLEKAMRVLKKKVQKEGIIKDLRAKQYYEKPSEIKRRKKKEGIKNFKKKMKKLEQLRGY